MKQQSIPDSAAALVNAITAANMQIYAIRDLGGEWQQMQLMLYELTNGVTTALDSAWHAVQRLHIIAASECKRIESNKLMFDRLNESLEG